MNQYRIKAEIENPDEMPYITGMTYKIAAFYRFVTIPDTHALRAEITAFGKDLDGMCGTILLAPEGVNGTIGAKPAALDQMVDFLDAQLGVRRGELKYSDSANTPFNRFKVRPKKEIITLRKPEADPNVQVGQYVEAADWNALMNDPDVTIIDTRNTYETEIGIFKGAIDPKLNVFSEFPDWVEKNLDPKKHKKVAMFCTGGIRCEKASSYMLAQGFENVYHLKGGILKYLETVSTDESKWDGACFVFDKRVSVIHGLAEGRHTICHGCREPLTPEDVAHEKYEEGVSCARCADALTPERAAKLRHRHKQYMERYSG